MRTLAQWRLVRRLLAARRRFRSDDLGTLASALAFQAFLSLFPLMLLGLSVAGFLLSGDPADTVRRFFDAVPGIGPLLDRNLDQVVRARGSLGLIALAGVLWSATALAGKGTRSLARIFRTHDPGLLRRRVRALVSILVLGALLLAALLLSGVVANLELPGGAGVLERLASWIAIAGFELAFFLLSYRLLTPEGGPGLRDHLPGALLMALGWTVLKLAGGLLVTRVVANASALYGTIGAVFGLLVFLRIATALWLAGAELTALVREERREPAGL